MQAEDSAPSERPTEGPAREASYGPVRAASHRFACVLCGGQVLRVRRRAVDRLINLVNPCWRYRCVSRECGWEGRGPAGY